MVKGSNEIHTLPRALVILWLIAFYSWHIFPFSCKLKFESDFSVFCHPFSNYARSNILWFERSLGLIAGYKYRWVDFKILGAKI